MFELPEHITLAGQMNKSIKGKSVRVGTLGGACYFCPACQT
jgi:hypothetical protein